MAKRILYIGMIITIIVTIWLIYLDSTPEIDRAQAQTGSALVTLQAGSGETIEFQTQNGITRQGVKPTVSQIPRLILYHNHMLTEVSQRTLHLSIQGLQIPPPGATVNLLAETQEKSAEYYDPDLDSYQKKRIPVWEASAWMAAAEGGSSLTLSQTFENTLPGADRPVHTPTGYFRYHITISAAGDSTNTVLYEFERDHAFLMENLWTATLPEVPEESPGAAPDELVIYYSDMTRFQKDFRDDRARIPRQAVHDYVGTQLLPRMVAAFGMQSQDWGFPWYQAWTGNRPGQDRERLSVALIDGVTWYHGQASPTGNSRISINVSGADNAPYASLADGVMATFHHELFHHQQKNINQYYGGQGWTGGEKGQWQFFSEGMAVLASSVAQPEIEFAEDAVERVYLKNANAFLTSDIGKDFGQIDPYHGALYWRFLYERCGAMGAGVEHPAAGMTVIRRVLTSLYQITEGQAGNGATLDDWMPAIMDQALTGSSCPFQTYQDSLAAFGQAVEALSSQGGRCQSSDLTSGCAFYDPFALYYQPIVRNP